MIKQIRKRDGRIVDFDKNKITEAIWKAAQSVGGKDRKLAEKIADDVVSFLEKQINENEIPTVEQVQDCVEKILIEGGYAKTAKSYILYRQKRAEIRRARALLGIEDDMKLPLNSLTVLASRYLRKDENLNIVETPKQLFRRVAKAIASADKLYGKTDEEVSKIEDEFFEMMSKLEFSPNSPTLMNAGTNLGQLSACFVLPVEDNIESIYDAIKAMALVQKSGGGTGFSFSKLRPAGDIVKSTAGVSSGPLTFMQAFNVNTDVIKQGGCISSNSFIRTDKGIMPVKYLLDCPPLGENFTKYLVYDGSSFNNAFIASDNGLADTIQFRTDINLKIDATYNHQIACVNEDGKIVWKYANDIKEGDWLVVVLGGHKGEDIELPPLKKQHFNSNPIRIPEKITPEIAELLGLYMSDGCSSTNGRLIFSIENKDVEVMEKIERIMVNMFGLEIGCKEIENNYTDIIFYSRDLQRYFEMLGWLKESSSKAFVPECIFKSPKEVVYAFMRGLFEGDGDVHADGYPRLYSSSESLVEQVQQLLLSLNIISNVHVYKTQNSFGKLPKHHLNIIQSRSIELFRDNIGFVTRRKNNTLKERIHKKVTEPSDVIPNQGKKLKSFYIYVGRGSGKCRSKRGANSKLYKTIYHYITGNQKNKRNLTRKKLLELMNRFPILKSDKHLMNMADYKYFYTKVVGIKKNKTYTMDIEVPLSSSFVANGILVHNKRRGANMGILRVDHPDILDFIVIKETEGTLNNFNLSVALTDKFMDAVFKDKDVELINPRTKKPVKRMKARAIWNLIITMAWRNGEPGVIFIDTINKSNPTPHIGQIESTNPCGEQPLLPHESCNLGSINLSKMTNDGQIDWEKLKNTVRKAIHFLDNVIDVNKYPLPEIERMTKLNRKVGLGVMGFADMLIQIGIPYNSEDALKTAENIMKFITDEARQMSVELGKERGSFPNFKGSIWENKFGAMRNATVTTIAPTGSIGVIAGCSSGIEPLFAISYVRNVGETIGADLIEVNQLFENIGIKEGFYSEELMKKISKKASVQGIEDIPENIRKIFVTAHDISPEWHIRMQAAFQKFTDNAVSKTVNFPYYATPQDIEKVYVLAYKLGCKGVTVYRDGSRKIQVLTTEESLQPKKSVVDFEMRADADYSGGCSTCHI